MQKSFSASTWRRLTENYPHHSPLSARTSHPPLLHSMWRNPRKVLSRARAICRLRWEGETTQYANPSLDELAVVYLYARARIGSPGTVNSSISQIFEGKFRTTVRMVGQPDTITFERWRSLKLDIHVRFPSTLLTFRPCIYSGDLTTPNISRRPIQYTPFETHSPTSHNLTLCRSSHLA